MTAFTSFKTGMAVEGQRRRRQETNVSFTGGAINSIGQPDHQRITTSGFRSNHVSGTPVNEVLSISIDSDIALPDHGNNTTPEPSSATDDYWGWASSTLREAAADGSYPTARTEHYVATGFITSNVLFWEGTNVKGSSITTAEQTALHSSTGIVFNGYRYFASTTSYRSGGGDAGYPIRREPVNTSWQVTIRDENDNLLEQGTFELADSDGKSYTAAEISDRLADFTINLANSSDSELLNTTWTRGADSEAPAVEAGFYFTINSLPTLTANDPEVFVRLPGNLGQRTISITTTDNIEAVIDKIVTAYSSVAGTSVTKHNASTVKVSRFADVEWYAEVFILFGVNYGYASMYELTGSSGTLSTTFTDINDSTNTNTRTDSTGTSYSTIAHSGNIAQFNNSQGNGLLRRTHINTNKDHNFNIAITTTPNGATAAAPILNASSFATDGVPQVGQSSVYTVTAPGNEQITTFTHFVEDSDSSDTLVVNNRIIEAINNNNETPIDFTATADDSDIVLVAAGNGPINGLFTITASHPGSGNDVGDISYVTTRTQEGYGDPYTITITGGGLTEPFVYKSMASINAAGLQSAMETFIDSDSAVTFSNGIMSSVAYQEYPPLDFNVDYAVNTLQYDLSTIVYGDSI